MSELEKTTQTTNDERQMALFSHLSAFILSIIGPAIILNIKGTESRFVAYHAKQALLYQAVTLAINLIIIMAVMFISCGMCFPILFLPLCTAFYGLYIGLKANKGEWVGYMMMDTFGLPEGQELDN